MPRTPQDQGKRSTGENTDDPPIRPALVISDAAKECQVGKSTIRRRLDAGAFPNAWREDTPDGPRTGSWRIPVVDLIQAGFSLNHSANTPDPVREQRSGQPGEQVRTDLELRLVRAESERDMYRAIAGERETALEDMRRAMRMLEPAASPVGRIEIEKSDPGRYGWFGRRARRRPRTP